MGLFNTFARTVTVNNVAAGLTLLPPANGGPSLLRDWSTYQTLDHLVGPPIEFSRGSTATFTGSNGLIQSAATNAPRFDYDPITLACRGLLIEEARTNLLLQSQNFGTTWWATTGMARTSGFVAPDGGSQAWSIVPSATTDFHRLSQSTSVVSGTSYTISVYAKANGYNFIRLEHGGIGVSQFNLQTGVVTYTEGSPVTSIINVGNGWFRCTMSKTSAAVGPVYIYPLATGAGSQNYTANGTSGVLLWGAQVEEGAFATSYIPTTTATVTRSADVAQITGSNFTSLWNASAGAAYAVFQSNGNMASGSRYYNSRAIGYDNFSELLGSGGASNKNVLAIYNPFSTPAVLNSAISGADFTLAPVRGAMSYASTGRSLVGNGGTVVSDAGTIGAITQFRFGMDNSGSWLNGWLSSIAYYRTRLTDAQLQTLTA